MRREGSALIELTEDTYLNVALVLEIKHDLGIMVGITLIVYMLSCSGDHHRVSCAQVYEVRRRDRQPLKLSKEAGFRGSDEVGDRALAETFGFFKGWIKRAARGVIGKGGAEVAAKALVESLPGA